MTTPPDPPPRGGAAPSSRTGRRRARLRAELLDERVPFPLDGAMGELLVEEIDHARYPPVHEGHVATYGALVTDRPLTSVTTGPQRADQVPLDDVALPQARRLADGRGAFLVRRTDGACSLVCFEHSIEYEANLVALASQLPAHVVQRTARGNVKVVTPEAVVVWDGVRWLQKPHARNFHGLISRLVPEVDLDVLGGLLELCVHWLSPGGRGATLVWSLHRPAEALDGLDRRGCMPRPRLSLARRDHFAALFSLHAQVDGATLVDPDGSTHHYGTTLVPSRQAVDTVPPHRGTRHTSARRYSYDHPGTLVVVVSEDGPVSVFLDGARIVLVSSDPAHTLPAAQDDSPHDAEQQEVRCPNCRRVLLVDLPRDRSAPRQPLLCPVCDEPAGRVAIGAATRGVHTSGRERRADRPTAAPSGTAGQGPGEPRRP